MNIVIREAVLDDADALAHVLVTATRAAFEGVVPEYCLQWSEPESAANWKIALTEGFDAGEFLVVAETADGLVIGYAMGGSSTDNPVYRGELKALYVLPAYHRRGIGRLLVKHVASRLAEQGVQSLFVRVMKDNPNRPFYERMGGQYLSERPYDWDSYILPEYVYGWKDTGRLLNEE